jgi:tetratricopeptide (TPR) repeat protein
VIHDVRGVPIVAADDASVVAFDEAIDAYAIASADTRARVDAAIAGDPSCVMTRALDGYLHMLSSKREGLARAREVARDVAAMRASGRRETLHVTALDAWSGGDMRGAARVWDTLLDEFPRDLLALKVSQFVLSYLGESQRMRETVARVMPAWDASVPGYGFLLGCHAYALEEAGDYAEAEDAGRRAVALDTRDIWAAHAVAHVTEMEGRLHDGIGWITSLASEWSGCSTFARHLRWHEGLFHLELDQHERVLALYDREVRAESTDEYLDVANAVSLLWRLEQAQVDVGARWRELADRARARIDDHALVFIDLHYLMALAADADTAATTRFIESCEHFAASPSGTEAVVMADVGLPLARAILAHRRGAYDTAVNLLHPVRHLVRRIGGSHAQRDVFEQLLIDAAWRGQRLDVAAELLAERTTRRPGNVWGWKHRAAVLEASGGDAREAQRELDRLRGLHTTNDQP